jgi:hypothetical protein
MLRAQAIKPALRRHAWARNKQGPSPASCSRPRPHRTHQDCTSVPRLVFKYALQARRARHFPAVSAFHLSPLLCRAACYYSVWTSVIPSAFCQHSPRVAAVHSHPRRFRFASRFKLTFHACMRAPVLRSHTPTTPRYSNTTAQMPDTRFALPSI